MCQASTIWIEMSEEYIVGFYAVWQGIVKRFVPSTIVAVVLIADDSLVVALVVVVIKYAFGAVCHWRKGT